MPKIEAKTIQQELDKNRVWPVYWLYGAERLKSRELLGRIKKRVLGESTSASSAGLAALQEERIEGTDADADQVVDSAMSPSLMGGVRLIVVRDAHALGNPERLAPLLTAPGPVESLGAVCVFLSKDLDGRKKISKLLLEKAAVVSCEEVPESEREAWIQYLAKRKSVTITPDVMPALLAQEPWGLELIDQELEKLSLSQSTGADTDDLAIREGTYFKQAPQKWLEAFLSRNHREALPWVSAFADELDQALPMLGLLSWNVRQLASMLAGSGERMNPYVADRLRAVAPHWKLSDVLKLQGELTRVDHAIKQTGLLPLGIWSDLTTQFTK